MKLDVFLYDTKCGELYSTSDKGIVFDYSEAYISKPQSIPLSISLPLEKKHFSQKECFSYFYGLLPEGNIKKKIAANLHISETSVLKLLKALGGECAGTVSLFNSEEKYPIPQIKYEFNESNYRLISQEEISTLLQNSITVPVVNSIPDYRLSLAGAQEKLALAYINGKWYVPLNGAPSTHIIKPPRNDFSDISANEYICMTIAKEFLFQVPKVQLLKIKDKNKEFEVFCIERYDRKISFDNGKMYIQRIHQEDFCQALGISSDYKYQNDGGPGISDIINLVREKSSVPIIDIQRIVELLIFQLYIGNCDAHGKNYSFLFDDGIRLSPAYDIISTVIYPSLSRKLSMKIGKYYEIERLSKIHLLETFEKCKIKKSTVNKIIDSFNKKTETLQTKLKSDKQVLQNEKLFISILNWMKTVTQLASEFDSE